MSDCRSLVPPLTSGGSSGCSTPPTPGSPRIFKNAKEALKILKAEEPQIILHICKVEKGKGEDGDDDGDNNCRVHSCIFETHHFSRSPPFKVENDGLDNKFNDKLIKSEIQNEPKNDPLTKLAKIQVPSTFLFQTKMNDHRQNSNGHTQAQTHANHPQSDTSSPLVKSEEMDRLINPSVNYNWTGCHKKFDYHKNFLLKNSEGNLTDTSKKFEYNSTSSSLNNCNNSSNGESRSNSVNIAKSGEVVETTKNIDNRTSPSIEVNQPKFSLKSLKRNKKYLITQKFERRNCHVCGFCCRIYTEIMEALRHIQTCEKRTRRAAHDLLRSHTLMNRPKKHVAPPSSSSCTDAVLIYDESEYDATLYCICKGKGEGVMVECCSTKCLDKWFHFSCVKLRRKPKGFWLCPQCSSRKKKNKKIPQEHTAQLVRQPSISL